jgi:hypothetical protein
MTGSARSKDAIAAAAAAMAAWAFLATQPSFAIAGDAFPAGGVMPEGWIVAPGAAAGWAIASDLPFEGTFSLKSEPVGNDQFAGIEVSGAFVAGTASFARRVSSEEGYDFLRFYIDGVLQQEWSGDVGWAVAAYGVNAGTHTFRWEYSKDVAVAAGADAAWIDAVVLPARSTVPTFAFGAASLAIGEAAKSVSISVHRTGSTSGTASVRYATSNGTAVVGEDYVATSGTLSFGNGEATKTVSVPVVDDGASEVGETFTVTLTNPSAGAIVASPATVSVAIADDDDVFPAGGAVPTGWATSLGAAASWLVASDTAQEGSQSLRSGTIANRQAAAIEVSGTFATGSVSFARKVSSEPDFDHLRFYVDDVLQQQWSGELEWAMASFAVAAGGHTFRWEYVKDESVSMGTDAAWIDAVVLPPQGGEPPRLTGAASRRVHGAAGTFDLPLASTDTNPTTEPRVGPAHTIVFTFDKPVVGGAASVAEGIASVGVPTFKGHEMRVPLAGVANAQHVTVAVADVVAADGGIGGSAAVRVGFLVGDSTQNRAVTVSDLAQVNAQIAQPVNASNFLKDLNASGTLTVADKGIANTQITKALLAP